MLAARRWMSAFAGRPSSEPACRVIQARARACRIVCVRIVCVFCGDAEYRNGRYVGLRGTSTSFKTRDKAVIGVNYELRPKPTVNDVVSATGAALT